MSVADGPRPSGAGSGGTRALVGAVLGLTLIVAASTLYVFRSVRALPGELAQQGRGLLRDARSVAEAFRTGTLTTVFTSYATEVSGSNYLQFATLRQVEVFERTDALSVLWGQLALPEVIVEARVPVEYTYYLDLEKPWRLQLDGTSVLVTAPAIEWNAPALDASALRFEVRRGSLLRDERLASERLRQGLSAMARLRAEQNVPLVRELGRRKTEDFVERWLLQRFSDARDHRVSVVFADELPRLAPEAERARGLGP
jgi:hypothetical protein